MNKAWIIKIFDFIESFLQNNVVIDDLIDPAFCLDSNKVQSKVSDVF